MCHPPTHQMFPTLHPNVIHSLPCIISPSLTAPLTSSLCLHLHFISTFISLIYTGFPLLSTVFFTICTTCYVVCLLLTSLLQPSKSGVPPCIQPVCAVKLETLRQNITSCKPLTQHSQHGLYSKICGIQWCT